MKKMYDRPGREYQFIITSDGTNYSIRRKDIEDVTISGKYLKLPLGYMIADFNERMIGTATAATDVSMNLHLYADKSQGVSLPDPALFESLIMYIYAERG